MCDSSSEQGLEDVNDYVYGPLKCDYEILVTLQLNLSLCKQYADNHSKHNSSKICGIH